MLRKRINVHVFPWNSRVFPPFQNGTAHGAPRLPFLADPSLDTRGAKVGVVAHKQLLSVLERLDIAETNGTVRIFGLGKTALGYGPRHPHPLLFYVNLVLQLVGGPREINGYTTFQCRYRRI